MKKCFGVLVVVFFLFSFVGAYVYEYDSGVDFSLMPLDDLVMKYPERVDDDFSLSDIYDEDGSLTFSAKYARPMDDHLLDGPWGTPPGYGRIDVLAGVLDSDEELNGIYFIDVYNDDNVVAYYDYVKREGKRARTKPSPWFDSFYLARTWFRAVDGEVAVKIVYDIHLWPNNAEGPIYVEAGASGIPKIDDWYCGDTHYHSWYTNTEWAFGLIGEMGAPISFTSLIARNVMDFDWFTVTDHSNSFDRHKDDSWNWSAFVEECGRYNNCLVGEEVNCRTPESGGIIPLKNSLPGNHLLAYDIDEVFLDNGINDVPYCDEIINGVNGQGGFGYVAHPESSMDPYGVDIVMSWEDYGLLYTGLEVWNGDIDSGDTLVDLENGLEKWKDVLLGRGGLEARRVFVSAGSDAHGDFQEFGREYTCCYAEEYSKENIFGALENGNCYMGNNGAFVFEIDNLHGDVARMGEEVNVLKGGDFEFDVTYFVKEYCDLYFVEGIIGEENEFRTWVDEGWVRDKPVSYSASFSGVNDSVDSKRYYRFECVSPDGKKRIYTNPIWVNPIECFEDVDCGASFSESFCEGNSFCEKSVSYSCRNPGRDDAYCWEDVVEDCERCRFGCDEVGDYCRADGLCYVDSPMDGDVFTGNYVSFEVLGGDGLDLIEYIDSSALSPRWRRLCRDCDEYIGSRWFAEGEHDVSVRCLDSFDSEEYELNFVVDSVTPVILGIEPRGGFSNGSFSVRFREENPSRVYLYYGDSVEEIDVDDCIKNRRSWECDVLVDLPEGLVEYWFVVEDIAGRSVESSRNEVVVDNVAPVVNNPDSFWEVGNGWWSSYIDFDISITESNFDEVVVEYDSWGRTRVRRLCGRLDGGVCEKRFRVQNSYSNFRVVVRDEAGNEVVYFLEGL